MGVHGEICQIAADCQAGASGPSEGREFSDPIALVVDAGYVWVADYLNHRVQKLEPNGVFHRAWGKDVSTAAGDGFEVCIDVAATCQAGESGTAGGEFNLPDGIAGDPTGDIHVSDRNNHRIQRFGSFGNWQRAWGKNVDEAGGAGLEVCTVASNCQAGSFATALGGELDSPGGLASDPAGSLYVADRENSRIQRFADPPTPPGTTPTTPAPPKKKCKKGRKLKKGKCVKKKRKTRRRRGNAYFRFFFLHFFFLAAAAALPFFFRFLHFFFFAGGVATGGVGGVTAIARSNAPASQALPWGRVTPRASTPPAGPQFAIGTRFSAMPPEIAIVRIGTGSEPPIAGPPFSVAPPGTIPITPVASPVPSRCKRRRG